MHLLMRQISFAKFLSILAVVLVLSATSFLTPAPGGCAETTSPGVALPIQQKPADLLCGLKKAICYSGFRRGQHPNLGKGTKNPGDGEILEDLRILTRNHNFTLIRTYDAKADSEAVLRIIKANGLHLKVLLGAWLNAETNRPGKHLYSEKALATNKLENADEISRAIRLANQYSNIIVAVAVGNEALVNWSDHLVPVDSVIRYVRQVKASISQPVTVADNYEWWAQHGAALAKEVDFVSVHIYPIWEGKDIDDAMAHSIANIQAVRDALPHSQLVITEAGWATVASEFGARASEEKQKRYYHDLYAWTGKMNITTFWFEAFDEDWKGNPKDPLGAEKHWGLFTIDRKAKLAMYDLYPDLIPEKKGE